MEEEIKFKEEEKFLRSVKSKTGTLFLCLSVGFLLGVIVIVFPIPVCSYNPSALDDLKREVTFFDLSGGSIYIIFLYAASYLLMYGYMAFQIGKGRWRRITDKHLLLGIVFAVFAGISVLNLYNLCDSYEIPESMFKNAPIQLDAGFYLFAAGVIGMIICMANFIDRLIALAKGKLSLEDLKWKKASGDVENAVHKQEACSFGEKIEELNKLKNEGLISEEEFTRKKEELLKNYR